VAAIVNHPGGCLGHADVSTSWRCAPSTNRTVRSASCEDGLAPVLAVGGVGLTLLTRPVFSGDHPSGAIELVATTIGLLGADTLVLASAYVPTPETARVQRQRQSGARCHP
jgi:hypothetical protein